MAANLVKCEVPGCTRYATQAHHIYTIGANSNARVPANEFKTCGEHHTLTGDSWHVKGRDSFAADHGLKDRVRQARLAVKGY